jgi:Holliday junction resolvase
MSPYARRVDRNHGAIRSALRASGWQVMDMSGAGNGCPDLLAAKAGRVLFVEVKDGAKVASARTLTPAQVQLHAQFAAAGVPVVIVTSVEQVGNL